MNRILTAAVTIAAASFLTSAPSSAASFTLLGYLPGGGVSGAEAVSADGSVVVGTGSSSNGTYEAFRWTSGGGMVGLGNFPSSVFESFAYDVSADGSVVVGVGHASTNFGGTSMAYRWTEADGMVGISGNAVAESVSSDGNVVAGTTGYTPFLWSGTPVSLGGTAYANAVSGDGLTVVGRLYTPTSVAFRWTSGEGYVGLGGGTTEAFGASHDGSVIVGEGAGGGYRWTSGGGVSYLSDFGTAEDVSADGSIVVGEGDIGSSRGGEALIWTEESGTQALFDLLVNAGVTGLDGWLLTGVKSVSADGQWVAGAALCPTCTLGGGQAFIANIAVVPIPAAAWLFAGALGALGSLRRKFAA